MRIIKSFLKVLVLAAGIQLTAANAHAAQDPDIVKVYEGFLNEIVPDPSGTIAATKETVDGIFYSTLGTTIENPSGDQITNVVSLLIREEWIAKIKTDFTAQVNIKVEYTLIDGTTGEVPSYNLQVTYNKASGLKYNQRQTLKFDRCRKVKVTILSVTSSVTSWNIWEVMNLENRMQIRRDYIFDYNALLTASHINPASIADELEISWTADPQVARGKTHIDIEWTWVDAEALDDYKTIDPSDNTAKLDAILLFKNNSSRITIESKNGNSYKVPLIYDGAGFLFYRIRPVQYKENGLVVNGNWSADAYTGITYCTRAAGEGHQENLNWQTTTSFAEDGKRKTVVQYFDGTLRGRQTVTKDNVSNKTVVAETFYDYQGRPAINILPAPTMNSIIQFTADFNKFEGTYVTPKEAFDVMPAGISVCDFLTPKLDKFHSTGAAQYYSDQNPEKEIGFNKFIPDANGFAYTETRYTPDATGRIEAQGGVGENYQLGKGNNGNDHDTKYFYGKPDQKELDALFGTEAGDATHYSKNMVRDANGQYSVSYVDMHGRTVATALAGTPPDNVKPLDSYTQRQQTITKNLLSKKNNNIEGRSIISSTSLIVTDSGPHEFHYELTPGSVEIAACLPQGSSFCYDCYYDLEIRITGGCNVSIVKTATNLSFNNGNPVYDQSCQVLPGAITVDFTETLEEGEYNITKKLTVSKPAQDWYRENVYNSHNICKTLEQFYNENYAIMQSQSTCEITCEQCNAVLGLYPPYRERFLLQLGYTLQDINNPAFSVPFENEIQKSYNDAKANCEAICTGGPKNALGAIRDAMLDDMSPGMGQYARLDEDLDNSGSINPNHGAADYNADYGMFETNTTLDYNIFSPFNAQRNQDYKKPENEDGKKYYKDEFGNNDPDAADLNNMDVVTFANKFKNSWATALIKYHPEYCILQKAENTPSVKNSYQWDAALEEMDTWQEAAAAGYTAANGAGILNNDPFFKTGGAGNGYRSTMEQYISSNFNRYHLQQETSIKTLWKLSWISVFCLNNDVTACADNAPLTPGQFTGLNNGCDGDWNYVWRIFRTLYLSEKERMVNEWLAQGCNIDYNRLNELHYERRFGKPEEYYNGIGYMQAILSAANNDPNNADASTQQELQQQYADNCESYKKGWIKQLEECDLINGHPQKTDIITAITDGLKNVCIGGSDADHPMGSSTVAPGILNAPQSFQEVLISVFTTYGINISAVCNENIVDFPPPYDKQPPIGEEPVTEQKDDCICTRLTELIAEKNSDPYFMSYGTLSQFIFYKHNITVRQSLIDSLLAGCNGTCNFWDKPFQVPAIFSCQTPIKNCIECAEYDALKDQFATRFPGFATGVPFETPQNDDELNANKAFAKFMNSKTGFSKTWQEYFVFERTCHQATTPPPSNYTIDCQDLMNIWGGFRSQYYNFPSYNITYSGGCDISSWQFFRTPPVTFSTLFNNGIVTAPGGDFHFDYNHAMCITDLFTVNYRIRPHDNAAPTGQLYLPISLQTAAGAKIFYIWLGHTGGSTQDDCNSCPDPGSVSSAGLALQYNQWMDIAVKIRPSDGHVWIYINGILVQDRSTRLTGITQIKNISIQTFQNMEMELDRFRVDNNMNGETVLKEEFNNACYSFAVMNPKYDCGKLPCDQAFAAYYNQLKNTSYTYAQLQALYMSSCNIALDACTPPASYPTIKLCGVTSMFPPVEVDESCDSYLPTLVLNKSLEQYWVYLEDKKDAFDKTYLSKCLEAKDHEKFTVTAPVAEYHYTLYYYDQAGNLVKTVPPAGVKPDFTQGFFDAVDAARANEALPPVVPQHLLVTQYRYNALKQVTAQKSPDGGTSHFWYDYLGRLVVSQNEKQLQENKYSYTLYDELGRIKEVGQKTNSTGMTQGISQNKDLLYHWITDVLNREQITRTTYDFKAGNLSLDYPPMQQQNLRNRVSFSQVFNYDPGLAENFTDHASATYYTYDIHGNVDVLLQDYKTTMGGFGANRFKKMTYQYDLVSGKVNEVAYQPGYADAFYHRYSYDAENKLTEVFTSKDSVYWEQEASYKYYRHGPLARTVLGQLEVQGIDYAYTLQGWLKGVNSTGLQGGGTIGNGEDCGPGSAVENLYVYKRQDPFPPKYVARTSVNLMPDEFESPLPDEFEAYTDPNLAGCGGDGTAGDEINNPANNALFDMGQDGKTDASGNFIKTTNPSLYGNNTRTTDAYGFSLNYFNGDYAHVGTAPVPFAALNMQLATNDPENQQTAKSLFNGNIAAMTVAIPKLGQTKVYGYNYDQLNRITNMQVFNGINSSTNTFTPVPITDYREAVTYDANGNILTYKRNGVNHAVAGSPGGLFMDDLLYEYIPNTNKLKRVTDDPAYSGNYANDIDNQTEAENYVYDEIGNLIQDKAEGITITWNVYGKIATIIKEKNGHTTDIAYTYDVTGNRISKKVTEHNIPRWLTTWTFYVRDASGNVMSVYNAGGEVNNGELTQTEIHLYGSSRLGIYKQEVNVQTESRVYISMSGVTGNLAEQFTFTRGNKFFELSNHLGNVLVTVNDRVLPVFNTDGITLSYYKADIITATDYYPFGMAMPGRSLSNKDYRYGFNGKENDKDAGEGIQDYGMRIYDVRLGKFLSVDPLMASYPWYTPYQFAGNKPLQFIDLDGAEEFPYKHPKQYPVIGKASRYTTKAGDDATTYWIKGEDKNYLVTQVTVYEEWKDKLGLVHHFNNYYFVQDKAVVNDNDVKTSDKSTFKSSGTNWHLYMSDKQGSSEAFKISQAGVDALGEGIFGLAAGTTALFALPTLISSLPSFTTASVSARTINTGVDYVSQVAGNYISGKSGSEAWIGNINLTSLSASFINPGSSWGRLAVNNATSSFFSVTAQEGYNGIAEGGGKDPWVATKQTVIGIFAGRFTRGIDSRINRLSGRLNNVTSILGSGSPLGTYLQSTIRNTQWLGVRISLTTGSAGNAINNAVEGTEH